LAWLTNWNKRKQLSINGTSFGSQSSYQMKITIYYGSGTDSSGNIYCNGYCKTDFSDIRFTNTDGTTLLSYWIESSTPSSNAAIWVNIPSIPTGSNSTYIYIYYNNSGATSLSNAPSTFIFYDDFSELNLNKWTIGGSTWSASNGYLAATSPSTEGWIYANSVNIDNLAVNYSLYTGRAVIPLLMLNYQNYSNFYYFSGTQNATSCQGSSTTNTGIDIASKYTGTWGYDSTTLTNVVSEPDATWVKRLITSRYDGTNRILEIRDPTSNSLLGSFTFANRFNSGTIGFRVHDSLNCVENFTNIRVRTYASPEPSWGTVGPEQQSGNALFIAGD
jgi:hypothetical protein